MYSRRSIGEKENSEVYGILREAICWSCHSSSREVSLASCSGVGDSIFLIAGKSHENTVFYTEVSLYSLLRLAFIEPFINL